MKCKSKHPCRAVGLAVVALWPAVSFAQHTVSFSPSAEGITKSVATWGVDTAWPSFDNVRQSIANMGQANVDEVRLTFYTDEPLIDNGNGTFSLGANTRSRLDNHLSLVSLAGTNKAITFVPTVDATHSSYLAGSGVNVLQWTRLIKATQEYINSKPQFATTPISAIEPFNEPDYWAGQGNTAQLNAIVTQLKTYPEFQNTHLLAGSVLNSDQARHWYDNVPAATAGSSHLLGGSLSSYVDFINHVNASGKPFMNPELHSLGEAIIGAEYGMVAGTWWADVLRARGLFVQASDGKRLGYAADIGRQSAAAVYRAPDGSVRAFAGGLERFGQATAFRFVSDEDVYFNGIPVREYVLQTKRDENASATDNDFQNYGSWSNQGAYADIQDDPGSVPALDGYRWKIVNASGQVMEVANNRTDNGATIRLAADSGELNQQWNITRTRNGYYHLYNANSGLTAEVAGGSLNNGASVRQWGTADNSNQQWYIEDAGNGFAYIRNAFTHKYLTGSVAGNRQWDLLGSGPQLWKFELSNPTSGPVARYALSSDASDSAGTNHGTAFGSPAFGTGPKAGTQAMIFDGNNDYVQLPAAVGTSQDITISTWVKWNGGGAWQRIFDFGNNTRSYMFLTPSSAAGTMRFAITKDGNGAEQFLETAALPTGQWVHLTVTLGGQTAILYINGKPAVAGQMQLDLSFINPANNFIGRSQWPDPLFNGAITDFRIFDYALHLSQVPSLIHQAWTGKQSSTWTNAPGAVNWLFDAAPAAFAAGRSAIFNDYADRFDVNVADSLVLPGDVLFDHSRFDYTMSGTGSIGGSISLTKTGKAALTIANGNSHTGGTNLLAGTLNINHAAALGTGTFAIAGGTTIDNTSGNAIVFTNDIAQTWNGDFTFAGTNSLDLGDGTATLTGSRRLTVNGAGTLTVHNLAQTGGTHSFTKAGTGTLVIDGTVSYGGATILEAGTLVAGDDARQSMLDLAGIDIRGGSLVFAYTGDSPADAVLAILQAGFAQPTKFSTGAIRSSNLFAGGMLGWVDDPSTQTLTIAQTIAGDANLDRVVDFADLLAVSRSFGSSNAVWSQGDFDFNGVVDFLDLLALARNFNGTAPLWAGDAWTLTTQLIVPEPAVIAGGVFATMISLVRPSR